MTHFTIDWTWTALDLKICLPIILTLVFFSIYWFTSKSEKIKRIFYNKYDYDQASLKHIFFTKYFGFFFHGNISNNYMLNFFTRNHISRSWINLNLRNFSIFSFLDFCSISHYSSFDLSIRTEAKKSCKLSSNKGQSLVQKNAFY